MAESDSDEFFDAEDASLTQVGGLNTEPASLDSNVDFFVDKEALRIKADEVGQYASPV